MPSSNDRRGSRVVPLIGRWWIFAVEPGDIEIYIFDMTGKILYTYRKSHKEVGTFVANCRCDLPAGIYFYRLNHISDGDVVTQIKTMLVTP